MAGRKQLTRDDILLGLGQIDEYLKAKHVNGELCIFGGACLCLAFSARVSTKDVDAVFHPVAELRKAIFEVGIANGWEWNWVNDDVAGFASNRENALVGSSSLPDFENLTVLFPSAEYLLAMKCLAARTGDEDDPSPDIDDAIWLCQHLSISSEDQIKAVVREFYPDVAMTAKTDFFIFEIVSRLNHD